MFKSPFRREPTELDRAIDIVYARMYNVDLNSEEYALLLKHLKKLNKMKNEERSNRVSRDAMLAAGASVVGILIIVAYEHSHAMTSKGLGFVFKPKI